MTVPTRWTARALALLAGAALLAAAPAAAVILDGTNQCTVKLPDGNDVVLYGEYKSRIGKGNAMPNPPLLRPELGRVQSPSTRDKLDQIRRFGPQVVRRGEEQPSLADRLEEQRDAAILRAQQLREGWDAPTFHQHEKSNRFYYLPPNSALRLAKRPNASMPEFLFVRYTSEEREEAGGAQGGILHFLMEWRLDEKQEQQLRDLVAKRCRVNGQAGVLMGVVELEEADGKNSFRIVSATLSSEEFTRSVSKSSHAPTMPGGKVVAAANLNANGAQLFHSIAEKSKSISDLSIELTLGYVVQLPAAKGEIIFHWDRVQEEQETFFGSYGRQSDLLGGLGGESAYGEAEVESIFNTMLERGVVQFNFEGYRPDDEFSQQVMQAMLRFFTDSLMQPAPDSMDLPETEGEERVAPDFGDEELFGSTDTWVIDDNKLKSVYAAKKQIVRLDAGLATQRQFTMVGNLAGWYQDVRRTKCCIFDVNLNDPFFEHREIRFILDLDAREIFEDMLNYVTVNVRKKRESGNTFERSVTIDQDHLANRGVSASLTYAREGDDDSESYQYMTQWSVRGGNIYPAVGRWQRGQWEGVTLAPPIELWNVDVEGDLEQMAASDIARVTVELHYPLFGEETFKVIGLSPRLGEWMVSEPVYVDRGTRGFAYRLIIHHKKEGRMVLPWETRVGDRYVYATIPEDVLVAGDAREQAKAAAKELGRIGADKVLDKFSELFSDAD